MDSFVQCHYCKTTLTNPLELVCKHSFCSECLTRQIQNDKIFCPICNTEHVTPAGSLSSAKPDTLVPYLIGLSSGTPYAAITDDSPPTLQAECSGCQKNTDLRVCYHCDKPLCVACRTKHHESQKKDVDHSLHNLETKTGDLLVLSQALDTSRANRIQEYKTMKDQISSHVKDLIKRISDEEQDLQKKIDARIQTETEKIAITGREQQYLQKNKLALEDVEDKYRLQTNEMVLLKMHKDYLDTAQVWKGKLDANSARLNAKKEEELHFHPNNSDKHVAVVGTLTDSKVHISKKDAKHTGDQKSSRSCSIM